MNTLRMSSCMLILCSTYTVSSDESSYVYLSSASTGYDQTKTLPKSYIEVHSTLPNSWHRDWNSPSQSESDPREDQNTSDPVRPTKSRTLGLQCWLMLTHCKCVLSKVLQSQCALQRSASPVMKWLEKSTPKSLGSSNLKYLSTKDETIKDHKP